MKLPVIPGVTLPPHDWRTHRYAQPGALALVGISLFCLNCGTMVWYQDFFETGRVLGPGQTQIDANGWIIVPGELSVQHGFEGGWSAHARLGLAGTYDPYPPPPYMEGPDFPPQHILTSASVGAEKSLPDEGPLHAGASAELTGFVTDLNLRTPALAGAQGSAGVTASYYPMDWFGVYVPLRMTALIAGEQNRQVVFYPGVGLSFEPWHLVIRIAAATGAPLLLEGSETYTTLLPVPFLGLQFGLRW